MRQSHLVRSGPEVQSAVSGAIASGLRTIVVGGGDGTVSAVVDHLANRPGLTLGLLPMGTGNEVARVLGIPLDLDGACRVVAGGRVAEVDLVEADGNFFLHTALVGYPAQVNHTIPAGLKLRLGRVAYAYAFLLSLLRVKPFRATVTAGDERWEGETALVAVGNPEFHVPARILLPPSCMEKGGLIVYTPRDSRRTTLVRLAVGLWITRRRQPSLLHCLSADSVTVAADPPQAVDLDGEFGKVTPAEFRLARKALRVLVPAPS